MLCKMIVNYSFKQNLSLVCVSTEEEVDTQIVLMKATKLLRSEFSFSSITIQVER